jgi:hypothetical protein
MVDSACDKRLAHAFELANELAEDQRLVFVADEVVDEFEERLELGVGRSVAGFDEAGVATGPAQLDDFHQVPHRDASEDRHPSPLAMILRDAVQPCARHQMQGLRHNGDVGESDARGREREFEAAHPRLVFFLSTFLFRCSDGKQATTP